MSGLQRMFVLLNLVGLSVLALAGSGQAKSLDATVQTELQTQTNSEMALAVTPAVPAKSPQVAAPLLAQMNQPPSETPMMEESPDAMIEAGETSPGMPSTEAPLETLPTPSESSQTLPSPLDQSGTDIDALEPDPMQPDASTYDNSAPDYTYPASSEIDAQSPDTSMEQPYSGSSMDGSVQQPYPSSPMDGSTMENPSESSSDSSSTDDPAFDIQAQTDPLDPDTSEFSPGRATRSGPSYIGVGGNIGLGDGDTALGEGSFAIFSKIGLTRNLSARPAVLFSDDPTILLPITIDFIPLVTDVTEDVSSNLGIRVSPYFGVGAAISTGGDGAVDFLATGGVDIGLSDRFTGVVSVNASLFDNIAVGLMLGIGYNF